MSFQAPHSVLMIRPANFGFNPETASSNHFQLNKEIDDAQKLAIKEFDNMVLTLKDCGVEVLVFEDIPNPIKPDAIFPNNWFSTHSDGSMVVYPMMGENRRLEVRPDILEFLSNNYEVKRLLDLRELEAEEKYLEGTGSLIFDHVYKNVYACESPRTNARLNEQLAAKLGYLPMSFLSKDLQGQAIYHTNVMLSICEDLAIVCTDSIEHTIEKRLLVKALSKRHLLIEVDFKQMEQFACNCLEVERHGKRNALVMSTTAQQALRIDQIEKIEDKLDIVAVDIPTIETLGGGSARCMLAGIHLTKKS